MTQTIEDLMQQAIDAWGEDAQMLMALEECGELIAVLTQYMRGRRLKEEVAEEIADVSIMMRQLRMIFGYETVNEFEAGKIVRLKKRLKQQEVTDAIPEDAANEATFTQPNKAMNPNGYRREIQSNFAGEAINNQSI